MKQASKPKFFATPAAWRSWLEKNHAKQTELWVGFHKRKSGMPSITWPESVDGALCFGWIDGVRKSLGEDSYTIRFTARRPRSVWSAINIKRVGELAALKLMQPAGIEAFKSRADERSAIYAYEQRKGARLTPELEKRFRANKRAWKFFEAQPPWYRRTSSWWVVSAKKEETRLKRLTQLMEDSAQGKTIRQLTRNNPS